MCMQPSRKVIWDIINSLFLTLQLSNLVLLLSFRLANKRPLPLLPFFQISLKNSELKTTHNALQDCRVHFCRQPFWKQLYIALFCYCCKLQFQPHTPLLKVARYSFSRSIPPKFERKLRRHKQGFGKIDAKVVLDKEENWL